MSDKKTNEKMGEENNSRHENQIGSNKENTN